MAGGKRSVFWGIMLLLLAAALLASRLGYLEGIGFWPILFSVIFVGVLINGIAKGRFGNIFFSIAFLIIINDKLLHLEAITPWPVLGAALLCTIGLKMLFPRFGGWRWMVMKNRENMVGVDYQSGDCRNYENVFNSSVKYISGEVGQVNIENVFGGLSIYFMDALPAGGIINVHVESIFGSVVMYVPSTWDVQMNVQRVMGGAGETGRCNPDKTCEMRVNGETVFGEVKVIYV